MTGSSCRRLVLFLAIVLPAAATAAAPPHDEAPADAWPMARGCPAGTGRSAATLRLPLAERWHRSFEKTAFGAVPVIAGGVIYVGDLDGTFHALAVDTGATVWTHAGKSAGFPSAAAVSSDPAVPLVVVGDDAGGVVALERATGMVRWRYETGGEISGGPTILPAAAGGPAARVLVGSQDASLSALDLATGAVVWKHSIADQIRCSPTVAAAPDGDRVFLAGCDGKLHVIDVATGAEKAAVPIDGPTGTTPAAAGGRVFFGSEGGVFYGVDYVAGTVAWRTAGAAGGQSYRSSAAIADGPAGPLAIVGSRGKAVEAFAVNDGGRAWRRPLRGRVDAAPVVVAIAAAGQPPRQGVVVADAAGKVSVLDAATGDVAWEFDAGGGFSAGAAVAAGHVVLAADDGTVWCFAAGAGD
jgi:outer membrane protein assembly factor BamB